MVSYAVSWSGSSPVGTLSVQVSNDYALTPAGAVENAGTWTTITFQINGVPTQTAPVTGNSGTGFIDIDATAAYAMRLIYQATSGTGVMNAVVSGKVA